MSNLTNHTDNDEYNKLNNRLQRIEGQARGIQRLLNKMHTVHIYNPSIYYTICTKFLLSRTIRKSY